MKLKLAIKFYPNLQKQAEMCPEKELLSPDFAMPEPWQGYAIWSGNEQSFMHSTRLVVTDQNMFHLNFQIISIAQLGTNAKKDVENKEHKHSSISLGMMRTP